MNMQSHEWVTVQLTNERIQDLYRQAEAERLAKVARNNQAEAERISNQQRVENMVSALKRIMQPKPAQQNSVLVRNSRRTA